MSGSAASGYPVAVMNVYSVQDEIGELVRMEMKLPVGNAVGASTISASSLAVTVLEWTEKFDVELERESFCDALRATAIPGGSVRSKPFGWADSEFLDLSEWVGLMEDWFMLQTTM